MGKKLIRFDWAMKNLLQQKANFDILEGFLSELLRFEVKIEDVIKNDEEESGYEQFDFELKSNKSTTKVVASIQFSSKEDFLSDRAIATHKLVVKHTNFEGTRYLRTPIIYAIVIVDRPADQHDYLEVLQNTFVGVNNKSILPNSDVFPKYFILKPNNFDKIAENTLEEWFYFLKNGEVKEDFKAKGLDKAKEKLPAQS